MIEQFNTKAWKELELEIADIMAKYDAIAKPAFEALEMGIKQAYEKYHEKIKSGK